MFYARTVGRQRSNWSNWSKHVICAAPRRRDNRLSKEDIPDVVCSEEQQLNYEFSLKKNSHA